jgi:hypothetical protein
MLTIVDAKVDAPSARQLAALVFAQATGTHGCAARDLNPEPAVKSPLLCYQISALSVS